MAFSYACFPHKFVGAEKDILVLLDLFYTYGFFLVPMADFIQLPSNQGTY